LSNNVALLKTKREEKRQKQAEQKLMSLLDRIPLLHEGLNIKGKGYTTAKYKSFWTGNLIEDFDSLEDDNILIIYGPNYEPIL